jgi:hypothetical protein
VVGPRIVFVRFQSRESPKVTPWLDHVSRVVGHREPDDASDLGHGCFVWQLVSANNRELARSVGVYSSFESASANAQSVVDAHQRAVVAQVSEAGRGAYGWFASVDNTPVMTCSRWYVTDRDRRYSIDTAVKAVSTATLHAGARLSYPALRGGDFGRFR